MNLFQENINYNLNIYINSFLHTSLINFIRENSDKAWNWENISQNKNITMDIIKNLHNLSFCAWRRVGNDNFSDISFLDFFQKGEISLFSGFFALIIYVLEVMIRV